ncbi:MAG: polysaccharide deacetylase family protein [Bacteroidales bacterium]|nr:polysaccharide deacetylase family protein [Bacteroidales bacterium]
MLGGKGLIWDIPAQGKELFLTFDDGPDPETTPVILDMLEQYDVKATFFCVGENVDKHPDIYQKILAAGHAVGNHGYNHLKGWETEPEKYVENVEKCNAVVNSSLFRPPYGKIKRSQRISLRNRYNIIMWTVLSRDYDARVDKNTCLEKTWKYTRPGAIIVFHDHRKAIEKLQWVLPAYLQRAVDRGYYFEVLGVDVKF